VISKGVDIEQHGEASLAAVGPYWARWHPDAVAIRVGDVDVTWSELDQRVVGLAAGLQDRGVEAGDRVGILAGNCLEWCELALATLRAGGIVVPLNVRLSPPELSYVVDNAGCSLVACDSQLSELYDAVASEHEMVLRVGIGEAPGDVSLDELRSAEAALRPVAVGGNDPAIISYTSGTTGRPKGATLTHANVLASVSQWQHALGWTAESSFLLVAPLAFTGGIVSNFMSAYVVGGLLVVEQAFAPDRALELLASTPINTMFGVPVLWQAIAGVPGFDQADLSALTGAVTGGAPVPRALMQTYLDKGVTLSQAYSCTESCSSTAFPRADVAASKPHVAGWPMMNTEIRLVDEEGEEVAPGEVGEITIRGPQVMQGYWRNTEATAEALRGGWLHTGDLGSLDEEGNLAIVDRKNDMIISGGLNVYPAEIEKAISDLPGVAEVGAFGVPHERWGETVAVAVVGEVEPDQLVEHCQQNLGDYKVPRFVTISEEPLPRSMSGKVMRRELRESFDESAAVRTGAS
jgi:fatty-acyl-CoA synthase